MSESISKTRWVTGFEPWHLDALNFRAREARIFKKIDRSADAQVKAMQRGTAFTGFSEQGIIGCAGIVPVWRGVGHAWVVLGGNYKTHRIWVHKQVVGYLDKIIVGMNLKRVEATVSCDFIAGVQWLERMGFELEGKKRKYGPDGKDHYSYARIME
jgi:hypothetical protein|tara:strand:- start:285 stop:752 length:468 start_codon:yes stop_codon:yes gene_type:complete